MAVTVVPQAPRQGPSFGESFMQSAQQMMQFLLNKEQMELAKEKNKRDREAFDLEVERFQFDKAKQQAEIDAAGSMMTQLPAPIQAQMQNMNPQQRAAFVQQYMQFQQAQANLANTQAQTTAALGQVDHWQGLRDLQARDLDLQARRDAAAADENAARRSFTERQLALDEAELTQERNLRLDAIASGEFQTALQLAAASGDLPGFFESAYGEGAISPALIRSRLDGEGEASQEQQLTRYLAGLRVTPETRNIISDALREEVAPQDILTQLLTSEKIAEESKGVIALSFMSAYPDIRLPPPPPEDPGRWARIFSFLRKGQGQPEPLPPTLY